MQVDTVIQIDPNDSDAALARLKPDGAVAPLAAIDSYRGEPVIVKLSFGKDSMALLLALLDAGVNVVKCVEADTGWEALEHYHYVAKMRPWLCDKYGIDIVTVRADISLPPDRVAMAERIEAMMGLGDVEVPFSPFVRRTLKYANFSSRMVKWCTDDIKIKPAKLWIKEYLETSDTDPLICTGIRGGESLHRSNMPPREKWPNDLNLTEWRPLIHWDIPDVVNQLNRHGIPVHPLYHLGTNRVGCWPCVMSSKGDLKILANDQRRIDAIAELERCVKGINESLGRHEKHGMFFGPKPDDDGKWHLVPIVEKIRWAQTSRGTSMAQVRMFELSAPSACTRWGWCEPFDA